MGDTPIELSSNRFARLSACLIAVAFGLFLLTFPLYPLNGFLIDSFFRAGAGAPPDPRITLIAFDASATQGGESNLSADGLATLIARLNTQEPKAIGILADLDEKHYSIPELEKILAAIRTEVPVFVGFTDETSLGAPPPEAFGDRLVYAPGLISRDSFNFGADSVSRRVMVEIERTPTFYSRLATFVRGKTPEKVESLGASKHAFVNWQGPAGTYPIYPAWPLLNGGQTAAPLQNRIVLIGHARRTRPTQDFLLTPYSRVLGDTTALEGAAHGLVTLLEDRGLQRLPGWAVALLTVVTGILTVSLVIHLSPVGGISFMVLLLAAFWSAGWLALKYGGWWLDLAHPAVMAVAGYYLVVPFRLRAEYRKRWHYQQKTEMMAQLEMLKSNFLSLVSHDLKTPIARIQGNAELLLREGAALPEKQRKSLGAIVATTEHMSDYVETVLDLTRIESASMPLSKVSRDINETIREVIEEKRFLATEKNISIETDLEPLFSVRYDVRLMKRVIANLVENAIKYSPENSTITITSKEESNHVRVSVSDQGVGIAPDEQEKVFAKFYRAQGALGTKGTGLGLYLVKYFVELHKGGVSLQSQVGKGSTFAVTLPV